MSKAFKLIPNESEVAYAKRVRENETAPGERLNFAILTDEDVSTICARLYGNDPAYKQFMNRSRVQEAQMRSASFRGV